MAGNYILLLLIGIPFLGAPLSWLLGRKKESWMWLCAEALAALELAGFLTVFLLVLVQGGSFGWGSFAWEGFCGLGMHLYLDGFRALYGLIAAFMWAMTLLFSGEYMKHAHHRERYVLFTLLTLGATVGVFLSADLFTAFIFFEIMSFTSYTWVAQEESREALRAAETYLAVAVIGGLVMLMGLFILYHELGTLEIGALAEAVKNVAGLSAAQQEIRSRNIFAAAVCILFGYGAKAGVFPLHIWLPKAHPVAPAPASALLSGILTKAGIFGILALSCQLLFGNAAWGALILLLGVLTMFTGALLALFSVNLKRTLACSSVSQIGFILIGIGMQGLLGEEGTIAIRGSLLHMVNHSLIKLVLFMAAGVVFMNLHELELNKIRGFGRKKPFLNACFLMGALGIGGIPLWNGYLSKTLLHESVVEYRHLLAEGIAAGGSFFAGSVWMGLVEWIFLASGGMTVAYMLKLYLCLFVEKNEDSAQQQRFDGMRNYMNKRSSLALGSGALLLPLLGLLPGQLTNRLADMSSSFLNAQWVSEGWAPGGLEQVRVSYFSLENLKGAAISIVIGIFLYFVLVKGVLMKKEGDARVYVNRWPAWLDLEELVYRPLLLKLLPLVGGSLCRICDRLVDTVVVILRKTIYRDSKIPHELKEGTAFTHLVGSFLDGISGYFNHPDATEEELAEDEYMRQHLEGKYEHRLALAHEVREENSTIIGRSLSFGLFLACLGLLLTLLYMLVG